MNSDQSRILHSLQRNIIRGVITAGPLFITWLVFTFILGVLANAGLPLVKVLEAGTWFAGRVLAAERRSGGGPPIAVASDGTVF